MKTEKKLYPIALASTALVLFLVTIQPPPNQLANIDFDVIGTSDY